jgi:hypothetical protein
LIPKAATVSSQQTGDNRAAQNVINLAVAYYDEVLVMMNPLDVFETFIHRQEKKRESFRLYIDSMIALFGIDMTSSNPLRLQEELRNARDGLFRIGSCGQICDRIGTMCGKVRRIFFETMKEVRDPGKLDATRELVKLSQRVFVSSQHVTNVLDLYVLVRQNILELQSICFIK